jgi:tetratricopeptide (TPR) repeat protein
MPLPWSACLHFSLAVCLAVGLSAQSPAPGGAAGTSALQQGAVLLEREDPTGALQAFRQAVAEPQQSPLEGLLGLGRSHLMLGRSHAALRYGEEVLLQAPRHGEAMGLVVRALIRARQFDEAVHRSALFLRRSELPTVELQAARASALFRVQRTDEAAAAYQQVLQLDQQHAEAHLRLGSGLLAPAPAPVLPPMRTAVAAARRGEHLRAAELLQAVLADAPGHAVAHRLLGESLHALRTERSMASADPTFAALQAYWPQPAVQKLPIADFVPGYAQLGPSRRQVVDRAMAMFGRRLPKLLAVGASHDLLLELERTTDAGARSSLRGQRTFDGRVWDDVRGIGGLQAATGIEALDEAAQFGFDTLVHELAHQVHFFTFTPVQRARLKQLYQQALRDNRCLDFYAASNEAEYFGQGVEAFASLGKRPGGETTHGHTRFELFRLDHDLHQFIASLVDHDPLADVRARVPLLTVAVAVALRCGRPEDAVVAAGMLPQGPERDRLLALAEQELQAARCH